MMFYGWAADDLRERMWPPREETNVKKNKFTRIGKYITDRLAFLIKSSHTAGLIYSQLYVS